MIRQDQFLPAEVKIAWIASEEILSVADMSSLLGRTVLAAEHSCIVGWPLFEAAAAGRAGHIEEGGWEAGE